MTIAELRKRAAYWQNVLNLPEWKIFIKWGNTRKTDDAVGTCQWTTEELACLITLSRAQPDHEGTLIHEMLHLVLGGHRTMVDEYDEHQERAINRIAAALQGIEHE